MLDLELSLLLTSAAAAVGLRMRSLIFLPSKVGGADGRAEPSRGGDPSPLPIPPADFPPRNLAPPMAAAYLRTCTLICSIFWGCTSKYLCEIATRYR